ncbi:tRNA lysidine(34) synthetase TilS [Shewanella sp. SR44-3]|uniref:tRNA lysidine(34) synthetase TilS n=1 Tax=unclassified Shewanella TaxID=196818 RepID=UPI0015F81279|nr:tRNA lysidine(34) synthetase TilS [Shewanella sp. SR44-3]MBB1270692.1 tRNA lysidine(34) synthetase TilS [Shewanella sp. SR44-3]
MNITDICANIARLALPLLTPSDTCAALHSRAHGSDNGSEISLASAAKLVLAYSGGVDSELLAAGLSLFSQFHPQIDCRLLHVHHGLSAHADSWTEHCRNRAAIYNLPLIVEKVSVHKGKRESLEAKARTARYHAIAMHLHQNDILLTAHHEDDQLETLLLALKRGQGPKGLAAMGECQRKDHYWLLRPLLGVSRQQIEALAAAEALVHIEDDSNQDDSFDRNFLRLEIIPALKQRWPSYAQTASRSARLCAEQQEVIEEQTIARLHAYLDDTTPLEGTGFKLEHFAKESLIWQKLLFRGYLNALGLAAPSSSQLEQIITQQLQAKEDAKVSIDCEQYQVKRFAGKAFAIAKTTASTDVEKACLLQQLLAVILGDETCVNLSKPKYHSQDRAQVCHTWRLSISATGIRLVLPRDIASVSIQYGAPSSVKCQPHFRSKGRELKKLWQELQIPPWRRAQVPLIFYGEQLVAAVGFWVDKAYIAKGDDLGLQVALGAATEDVKSSFR